MIGESRDKARENTMMRIDEVDEDRLESPRHKNKSRLLKRESGESSSERNLKPSGKLQLIDRIHLLDS